MEGKEDTVLGSYKAITLPSSMQWSETFMVWIWKSITAHTLFSQAEGVYWYIGKLFCWFSSYTVAYLIDLDCKLLTGENCAGGESTFIIFWVDSQCINLIAWYVINVKANKTHRVSILILGA